MLSHVSSVDPLPLSGAVARIASYPSPMPPLQQQHIQPMQFPLLTEEHFMEHFMQFSEATGITLNEQDFMIDGRQVNPWALHRVVSARNGFDSVTANDEWPMVGAVLGFPPVSSWNPARLSYCGPAVAHRLQQLYQVSLRLFDQSYINSVIAGWRSSQTSGQGQGQITFHPPQRQTQSRPLTEHHVVGFVERDREGLHRAAQEQDQSGFRAGPTLAPTENSELLNQVQFNQADFQAIAHPPLQSTQNQLQQQHSGGELTSLSLQQRQVFLALRAEVLRGAMTPQQARGRLAMMQASLSHPFQPQQLPTRYPAGASGIAHQQAPSQQPIQPYKVPPLSEERFKSSFMPFIAATGIMLSERDLVIEGRQINLWALHKLVFLRNGFESVSTNDEWPMIGAALGFPLLSGGDAGQPPRCGPAIAHQLQWLYNDFLRHFDQAYINSVLARFRGLKALGQIPPQPPQPQAQLYQPTEVDYQSLLASTASESSVMSSETMGILQRFSCTSATDLEAHRVPQNVIAFVEQNREHLQCVARDQNGFRAGPTPTNDTPFDNHTQVNQAFAIQRTARPPHLIPSHQQLRQMQWQPLVQGPGKPNTLQPTQSFIAGVDPPVRSSMGGQMTGSNLSGGAQSQGGPMSVLMNPAGMNSVQSGPIFTQSAGAMQIRRPTLEEVIAVKRWVDEQKRIAFSRDFDFFANNSAIAENDIHEYHRNLDRLDQVLVNIEKYIPIAFAATKKEEVVKRVFDMMASAKFQLEELKNPNPRYVLELCTIRALIQEADNMDKGLRAVLGIGMDAHRVSLDGLPSPPPQSPPRLSSIAIPPLLTEPVVPVAPKEDESTERAKSDWEGLFGEVVGIAMAKLKI